MVLLFLNKYVKIVKMHILLHTFVVCKLPDQYTFTHSIQIIQKNNNNRYHKKYYQDYQVIRLNSQRMMKSPKVSVKFSSHQSLYSPIRNLKI